MDSIHTTCKTGYRAFLPLQPSSTPRAPPLSLYSPKMIFKSPPCSRMLFQGFHLQCIEAPPELTDSTQLEGIEDICPADVEEIKRWIERGTTPAKVREEMSSSRQTRCRFHTVHTFGGGDGGGFGRGQNSAPRFSFLREQSALAFLWGTTSRVRNPLIPQAFVFISLKNLKHDALPRRFTGLRFYPPSSARIGRVISAMTNEGCAASRLTASCDRIDRMGKTSQAVPFLACARELA